MNSRIIKIKQYTEFCQVPNSIAQNPTLSMKEKGLLICLMSLPDDWKIHKDQLQKFFPEGRDAIRSAFAMLEKKGYIKSVDLGKDEQGKFLGTEHYVSFMPIEAEFTGAGKRHTVQRDTVQRQAENPTLQINTLQKNSDKETFTGVSRDEFIEHGAYPLSVKPSFEDFWNSGIPRVDKDRAMRYWDKMPIKQREEAIAYVAKYVDSVDDRKYLKGAATFLNQKAWNNELIERKSAQSIAGAINTAASAVASRAERQSGYTD